MKKRFMPIMLLLLAIIVSISSCKKDKKTDEPETPEVPTEKTVKVVGEITSNTTWTADKTYILSGFVYVVNGVTLTIEPGTLIRGDKATMGSLIIERGARIIAQGTAEKPIVFTSNEPAGSRARGDWGGLIICGKASCNLPGGEGQIEGGPRSYYGGGSNPNDNDDSGILKYVRIEFAGYPFQPNKEINGLTLGAVGRGTTIDYVQVSYSNDDAFEWFGGTVNCKHLISFRTLDDDFDSDNGYNGYVQYAVALRDSAIADVSGSNGFESDNDASGTSATPQTKPVFCNISVFGPKTGSNNPYNPLYKRALHLRRNTACSIYNSVFVGFPTGLFIDGSASELNAQNDILQVQNTIIAGCNAANYFATSTKSNFNIRNWFFTTAYANDTVANASQLGISNPFNYLAPNFTAQSGSMLYGRASYSNSRLQNMQVENFIGAFGSTDWTAGWAEWNPQQKQY